MLRRRAVWCVLGGGVAGFAVSATGSGHCKSQSRKVPNNFLGAAVGKPAFEGTLCSKWYAYTLKERLPINHNTVKLVFSLPQPDDQYNLPACSTLEVGLFTSDGSAARRLYTPVTTNGTKGEFAVVVKLYPDGKLTPSLCSLQEGDWALARVKHLRLKYRRNMLPHVGMIAGGTGITPMLQVLRMALADPDDRTEFTLLYCNNQLCDVLLRSELSQLEAAHPQRLKVVHCLQRPPLGWMMEVGKINAAMILRHMPPPGYGQLWVCGPAGMMEAVAGVPWRMAAAVQRTNARGEVGQCPEAMNSNQMRYGVLHDCGYRAEDVYRF